MTTPPDSTGLWSAPDPSRPSPASPSPRSPSPWTQSPWAQPTTDVAGIPSWDPCTAPGFVTGRAGYPPPARTSSWAVTSLVAGILALVPVAAVTGVVALRRTARDGEHGRGMAVAGLVLAGAWTVLGALVVIVLSVGPTSDPGDEQMGDERLLRDRVVEAPTDQELAPPSTALVLGLEVGECFQLLGDPAASRVSCIGGHDGEIYLWFEPSGGTGYPGAEELVGQAEVTCAQAFEEYVGAEYLDSTVASSFYVPDVEGWSVGDRQIACAVTPFGEDELYGPARGGLS